MADIINLRQARKQKARAERETVAQSNRAVFGRSKADRLKHNAETLLARRRFDAAKRDVPDEA